MSLPKCGQQAVETIPLSENYIELDRTFHEISLKEDQGDEFDAARLWYGKRLTWQDLLAGFRTVILSEAGSGKTEEIRQAARRLRTQGKPAFFLRLEHLCDDFEIAFEEGNPSEFEQWLASDEEAWLFLDSVDEARLRLPQDFERGVRKIGLRLAPAFQRVHIVLSGRGTAWRPVTDLALCQKHLRFAASNLATSANSAATNSGAVVMEISAFRIVALDDLEARQVALFAEGRGIKAAKPFLDAIERADAWSMAARPDDLSELVEFWKKNHTIGNRLELMQASIARRLTERDQTRAAVARLSTDDAYFGARRLAAAATMLRESTIRVPDGLENSRGVPVGPVLPNWDENKCSALLTRPIFDEAIYGTVRFHHRTVREYLTAEWFKLLLDRETSRRKIETIFFRIQYGLEVIVPAMRPVLVWLILLDEKICARALRISPELIFEGGEPKALPLNARQKILRDVCETIRTSVMRSSTTDYRAVQRFADKDIGPYVKALLTKYRNNDDLTCFLLRMVWHGVNAECLPEAKAIAFNTKTRRYTRIAAFRAVLATGSSKDQQELRSRFLSEAAQLDREWLAELLDGLPPTAQSVEWLLACIAKLRKKDRHTVDRLPHALVNFIETLALPLLPVLLEGLSALIAKRPVVERRFCKISQRHGWLIKSAAYVVERLTEARHPAALKPPALSILHKLPSAQHYRDWDLQELRSNIPSLVPSWPELNHALFWYDVREARRRCERRRQERLTDFRQVPLFGAYWQFSSDDFDRILSDISDRTLFDDRLVALSLAFRIYVNAGRPRRWRQDLKVVVSAHTRLEAALHTHFHPPPLSEQQRRWRRSEKDYLRRSAEREATQAQQDQSWRGNLATHIELLRDNGLPRESDVSNHQYYLHEKMRSFDSQSPRWTTGYWQSLENEFGAEIARAFRDGVVAYWRRYIPKLRSEGKPWKSTPFSVLFGLSGLTIEARENPGWPAKLSEHEADIAFRYAMEELNGFPDWMPSLLVSFPDLIPDLLLQEVDCELRVEKAKSDSHYVLSDLSWSGSWAWPYVSQGILARLRAREPRNLSNLSYMLNIINGSGIGDVEIASLAERRSADRRLGHAARWFAVWVGVDPVRAVPAVSTRLQNISSKTKQTEFAMLFVTQLLGGHHGATYVRQAFRAPTHLKDLYLLMHNYIREREDIRRAGTGVYSPGIRDDAQRARSHLLALIEEIPGKESFLALTALSRLHPDASSRPWMSHHAKTKAELDANLSPWSIPQTLEFEDVIERTPATHRELFELAELRFLDLKDNLENGDSSIATILRRVARETEIRKYIGDWLREKAFSRYIIPQEEELADAKRPDLRVHAVTCDAPVAIELKLADNWTGTDLFERLETQLCGDYLRDNRSSRGLFVLVYRGDKMQWEVPGTGNRVHFAGLVEALQSHWLLLSERFLNIDDIRVIGIDLTVRCS